MYDERFVTPMRQELTQLGVEEMRTPQEVDAKLKNAQGTTLVVVNLRLGCAARNARPAVAKAIQHDTRPDYADHCVRGQDIDAVQRARVLHRLRTKLSPDRAAQGWKAGIHARASSDRRAARRRNCARSGGCVRQVLRRKNRRLVASLSHRVPVVRVVPLPSLDEGLAVR